MTVVDSSAVAGWIAEVQAQRVAAEARIRHGSTSRRMSHTEITNLVTSLRDLLHVLSNADAADKAQVYGQFGLTLTYDPGQMIVKAEARPDPIMYVGKCPRGDLNPHALYGH